MKTPILILLLLCLCTTTNAQNGKNCYRVYADSSSGTELFGYRNTKGKTVLKPAYLATYTESFCQMAIVFTQKHQWLGINAQGKVILVPFIFDNGPDYVQEGLFRFVENQKNGFCQPKRTKNNTGTIQLRNAV
ncbi:WG repeat-containing protein [Epilithonimonas xixisoli]|uniref:WG repeat protein n=1 Tax=Epilithonimonas xixisoli TaxID=1476462 RepID=A0A4R8IB64_9FLAO|nr:WG repeat-containing protein [Epilithonimonas xixisoli]TDX87287.1 hypothetical protein B0I22_1475 [Epilithonimonas xixisoli]